VPPQQQQRGPNFEDQFSKISVSLDQSAKKFGEFTQQIDKLVTSFNGMKMTHEVNINGTINVGGLNMEAVGEALKESIGGYIVDVVKQQFRSQKRDLEIRP